MGKYIIDLPKEYIGFNTNGREIPIGQYEIDDPRLFGTGQYLVEQGFAEVIGETSPPKPEPVRKIVAGKGKKSSKEEEKAVVVPEEEEPPANVVGNLTFGDNFVPDDIEE